MRTTQRRAGFVHRPVHIQVRIGGVARYLTTFIEDDVAPDSAAAEVKRLIESTGNIGAGAELADE